MGALDDWGTTALERAAAWPCDAHARPGERTLFRGISVEAPPALVFAWLCQLKRAPYSYDWIDNFGRRSPREREPEAERLECGQTFMKVFRLLEFEPDHSLTLASKPSLVIGRILVTYQVVPRDAGTRLLVRLRCRFPGNPLGWLARAILPTGDWIMMRKQLRTLKFLAERDAGRAA